MYNLGCWSVEKHYFFKTTLDCACLFTFDVL